MRLLISSLSTSSPSAVSIWGSAIAEAENATVSVFFEQLTATLPNSVIVVAAPHRDKQKH
jgi:hypothetical protein